MRSVRSLLLAIAICILLISLGAFPNALIPIPPAAHAEVLAQTYLYQFGGRVYAGVTGTEPPTAIPLVGVTVTLYGSQNSGQEGTLISQTTTDATGWYGLGLPREQYVWEYYNIIETNPAGYTSNGATTVGGTVRTADWIQYTSNIGTVTGNKFWDQPIAPTSTSTATRTATSRFTPTYTATSRFTPTLTATSRFTPTRTPTPTRTTIGQQTPTATPTRPTGGVDLSIEKKMVLPSSGPVAPGTAIQYNVVVWNHGPSTAHNVVFTDVMSSDLHLDGMASICALVKSGPPNDVIRCDLGDLATFPPGTLIWLQAKVDGAACGEVTNTVTLHSDTPDPNPSNNTSVLTTAVGPCPRREIEVTKTLVDPAGGVANVGDVVRFRIHVHNPNTVAVSGFDLEDRYAEAEFDFVSASPPPDVSSSNGTDHLLVWQNLSLAPGASLDVMVDLKTKLPGISATNCAYYVTPITGGNITGILGPASCASVRVQALEGKQAAVYKRFTIPSNHVAQLGDWLSFETQWMNVGTETSSEVRLHDYLSKPSVSSFLPLNFGFTWPFATGDWAKVTAAFKALDVASPVVNTAQWTTTWTDGSVISQTAQDYVYILDGEVGKGLFISKRLLAPTGGAVVSDTVTFQVVITNVTGIDLPGLSLTDTFPTPCLSFVSASIPPASVAPGAVTWNLGPLPLGQHVSLDIRFHADGPCPSALNCAEVRYQLPGVPPQSAAACAPAEIRGPLPRLTIDKRRLGPSPVGIGALVVWEIEVANHGTAPLAVVPLSDRFQIAHFDLDSTSPPADSFDPTSGLLQWNNVGPLAPGQVKVVTVRLKAKNAGLGVLNCAETRYMAGSTQLTPSDCDKVDIRTDPPSVRVDKTRVALDPAAPAAVGDPVTFHVAVQNTGPAPLTNIVVEDHFDANCLSFVNAPGMATFTGPGQLRWDIPALAVGDTLSWDVIFQVIGQCNPIQNCVVAHALGPAGEQVSSEACVEFGTVPPEPGLRVSKRLVAPQALPAAGDVLHFQIAVGNTGNSTLQVVSLNDQFDPGCLEYVSALPAPDSVDPAAGQLHWNNVGPLAPGATALVDVWLRLKDGCPNLVNCAHALWMVNGAPQMEANDCIELRLPGAGPISIYLPLVMKLYPFVAATPTATRTPKPSATATRRATATATQAAGVTPTPTTSSGALIFEDDFSDAGLSGWTANKGTWTNPGGYMHGVISGGDIAQNNYAATGTNLVYEGTVTLRSGRAAGLLIRSADNGETGYVLALDAHSSQLVMGRNNPAWIISSYEMTVEYNRAYQLKLTADGTKLEAYLNGEKVISTVESHYPSGGIGVMIYDATADFDDLSASSLP